MATPVAARTYSPWWIVRLVLLILAILCFLVEAFSGNPVFGGVELIPLGLAFGFASLLPL